MSGDLLQTKLYVPQIRPSLVPRPRLIKKLDKGQQQGSKLTLVSAPAGFGKTTLIADWIHQSQFCWLTLDTFDDDPNRFWQYVLAALQTAVPTLSAVRQQLLSSTPLPPLPALLTELLNELAGLAEPIVLALDDYHHIANPSIHEGLAYLLDHAPAQLHLILITRADPPLPLARLRGRGLLNEIRVADLRFTTAETTIFLREVMGLPLSADDIAALAARAEGWITGLQLTAVSLRGRKDTSDFIQKLSGSHHYILEYLTEEVMQQQPDDVQTFLLQTSILSRLTGPLCDAVTGRDDSQTILTQLHRQNLFITPLDDGRQWFRTHHLLADLLSNRLRQVTSPETIQALHHRASSWCEENGDWETAVAHAIAAADWERTTGLVAKAYTPLSSQGRIATWQRWLAQIPPQLVQSKPELLVRQGWVAFLNGKVKPAQAILQAARRTLIDLPTSPKSRALRGELATYLATIAFYHEQPAAIIQAAEEALAYLPPEELTSRVRATIALGLGDGLAGRTRKALSHYQEAAVLARTADHIFLLAHALEIVADGYLQMGQLRAAAATCQEIVTLGTKDRPAPLPFAGNGHIKLAAMNIEWGDLARAQEHMESGLALIQQGGLGYILFETHCIQAHLRWAEGDEPGGLAALGQAETIFRDIKSRIMAIQLAAFYVQYWLRTGDVVLAAAWAEGHQLTGEPINLDELPITGQEIQQVTLARILLAQGQPDEVLAIYDRGYDQAAQAGRMPRAMEIGLVAAAALQAKRETAAALETLRRVLALTRLEGHIQIFVAAGQVIQTLLHQLPDNERDDHVTRILDAFPDSSAAATPSPALVEPLSPRELETLRLVVAGLSNKQIAAEMTVTLNTVKKHTSHVYGKLGVNGRTQAIARARELNLV